MLLLSSIDGGQNFDTTLASDVPNNGNALVTVPEGTSTSNARLMVKASENIFYAVNQEEFTVDNSSFVFTVENPVEDFCFVFRSRRRVKISNQSFR